MGIHDARCNGEDLKGKAETRGRSHSVGILGVKVWRLSLSSLFGRRLFC